MQVFFFISEFYKIGNFARMIYHQSMIKSFVKYLIIFVCLCLQVAYASPIKVNDVVFDSSDSVVFISTSNTSENTIKIKKGYLQNPDRMFFDIENAVLTRKQGSFDFTYGKLENLKISQFSTNPYTVRVVMTCSSKLKPEDVKIMTVGGSIIVKLQNIKHSQDFMTPVYREVRSDSYDYFEKVKVNESIVVAQPQPAQIANQGEHGTVAPKSEPVRINQPLYESKLRSRYFISNVYAKNGALLLAGTGIYNFEKPFYLSPAEGSTYQRVVFDIPNAVLATKLRNKVFQLSPNENVKIGQFEPTKVRLVITSPNPEKYLAICGNDLQNILLAREDKIGGFHLFPNTSSLVAASLSAKKESQKDVDKFSLSFSDPIVYSIKRRNGSVDLILYNVNVDNVPALEKKFQTGHIQNVSVKKISAIGVKVNIPLKQKSTLDCLENLNATKLVFTVKSPQQVVTVAQTKNDFHGRVVVLDPGHGGYDPGAMRNNVMEKNMTISIAKKIERNLKAQGATVIMTRTDDKFVSLEDRVVISNNKKPDIFVSVHINSSENASAHGIETHYFKDDSLDLAKSIHEAMTSEIAETNRGILKSRFYVIRHTNQPSVLLELGFISNDDERNLLLLPEQQEKFAKAIADGINKYFEKKKKTGTK